MTELTRENYYDFDAVSNSSLTWLLPECGGSLKKYNYRSAIKDSLEETEAIRMGKLIHLYFENMTMDIFKQCPLPSPSIKAVCDLVVTLGKPTTENITVAINSLDYQKGWKLDTRINKILDEGLVYMIALEESARDKKELVSESEYAKLFEIAESMKTDLGWRLKRGDSIQYKHETPILFKWPKIGTKCKALIDFLVIDHEQMTIDIYDLKTTSIPLSIYFGHEAEQLDKDLMIEKVRVEGQMYKRHIHRQLAFYKVACEQAYPEYRVDIVGVIGVETVAPYEIGDCMIPHQYLQIGLNSINEAMRTLEKDNDMYDL
jgi:hypothetical protein